MRRLRWMLLGAVLSLGGCARMLGFEDIEVVSEPALPPDGGDGAVGPG